MKRMRWLVPILLLITACVAEQPRITARALDFKLIEFRFPPAEDGTRPSILCLAPIGASDLPPGVYECDVGKVAR